MFEKILTILSSGALAALISGGFVLVTKLLDRKWSKNDEIANIKKALNKIEMDTVRLQTLVMMSDYPDDTQEIMRLAEHYFKDLHGNWYLTTMFNKWLKDNNVASPEWFNKE